MNAQDIMTKEVLTVGPQTTVRGLAKILIKNQVSGVPVVDRKGKIVGVVSEADLVAKKGKQVKAIMSKKVISISEDTPVERIAALMTAHRIKRLLVMRDQRMVGIVSRADLVGAIAQGKHIALHTPIYDL